MECLTSGGLFNFPSYDPPVGNGASITENRDRMRNEDIRNNRGVTTAETHAMLNWGDHVISTDPMKWTVTVRKPR